jgi:hypothetical protein
MLQKYQLMLEVSRVKLIITLKIRFLKTLIYISFPQFLATFSRADADTRVSNEHHVSVLSVKGSHKTTVRKQSKDSW